MSASDAKWLDGDLRRRVVINLDLGADDWVEAARALDDIADQIRRGCHMEHVVSGGVAYGYVLSASDCPSMTHEEYVKRLRALLGRV